MSTPIEIPANAHEFVPILRALADSFLFHADNAEYYSEEERWRNRADGLRRAIDVLEGRDKLYPMVRPTGVADAAFQALAPAQEAQRQESNK